MEKRNLEQNGKGKKNLAHSNQLSIAWFDIYPSFLPSSLFLSLSFSLSLGYLLKLKSLEYVKSDLPRNTTSPLLLPYLELLVISYLESLELPESHYIFLHAYSRKTENKDPEKKGKKKKL